MTYESRSELRKECSKFLRFSYLVDFVAIEALDNIFIYSVKELEDKLVELVNLEDENVNRDQANKPSNPNPSNEPLFAVNL